MKNIILILFACFPVLTFAQLQDDFSDGDFTNNPTWIGNTDRYIVNADGELQLNHEDATGTSISYLSVAASTADLTNWEFKVRLDFSPSASNFARIYLNSNTPDVTGDVNGYFVKIGGISGSDDAIELWRQDGNSDELLISGTVGGAGEEPVEARIRVERNAFGGWVLLVDYAGGTNYVNEGGANDSTYNLGGYFGFWCSYTATRSDKFFLDDLLIEPLFVDTQEPAILSAMAESSTTVAVSFDEPIVAFDFGNFTINNGISVTSAVADMTNPALIRLTVTPDLQNFQNYVVTASNVMDAAGNVLTEGGVNFDFLQAQAVEEGDIIITEIMADPTPVIGLPDAEFVEIYNRSDKVIDLSSLSIVSDDSPDALVGELILPGEYVIICDDGFASDFTPFGQVAFAATMPTLSNGSDFVRIESNTGEEIDRVDYSNSWFEDDEKAAGGYTLERVGAQADSNCSGNWRGSDDNLGGTPGVVNSINGQFTDTEAPQIASVVAVDEFSILVTFSKSVNADEAREELNYTIDNGLTISSANIQNANNTAVLLLLNGELQSGTIYTLTVSNAISDCLGNMAAEDTTRSFILAGLVEPSDIIITEIMSDPAPALGLPEAEFVEIYNRSANVIDLNTLFFVSGNSPTILTGGLILPDEYVIVCDEEFVSDFTPFGKVAFISNMPALSDNNDFAMIENEEGIQIDRVDYSDSWFDIAEKAEGGYTLERIGAQAVSNCSGNWRGSNDNSGGTPGAANSINGQFTDTEAPKIASILAVSGSSILLTFSKSVNADEVQEELNYTVDNGLTVTSADIQNVNNTVVLLQLNDALQSNTTYTLTVSNAISDCLGNMAEEDNTRMFGLGEDVEPLDIVVNEILFNPRTGGADYVEFYNRSEKIINFSAFSTTPFAFLPGEYIVVSERPNIIPVQFTVENPQNLFLGDLPTLSNDSGEIALRMNGILIDSFAYNEDLHYELLNDVKGVSLERISTEAPTNDAGNWTSAASSVGFGTPTAKNSQFTPPEVIENGEFFQITTPRVSPDADGFEDVLLINYKFDELGYVGNIKIFDNQGRQVKSLINNELLATEGILSWDGSTDDKAKARVGIYVFWAELYRPDGTVVMQKEAIVVAGQLN